MRVLDVAKKELSGWLSVTLEVHLSYSEESHIDKSKDKTDMIQCLNTPRAPIEVRRNAERPERAPSSLHFSLI